MELCGLHSFSNGHTHVQEWHNEASAGYLPQKRKRSDVPMVTGDRSDRGAVYPAEETAGHHSKCL